MGNQESIPNNQYQVKKVKKIKPKFNETMQNYNTNTINNNTYSTNTHTNTNVKTKTKTINHPKEKKYEVYIDNTPNNNQYREKKSEKIHMNNAIVERSMFNNLPQKLDTIINPYPQNSNYDCIEPKKNLDNVKFTPFNFNDEVDKFKQGLSKEQQEFEENERKRREHFNKSHKEKEDYLNSQIRHFEENYNPWEILGLEYNDLDLNNIRKAYKKNALKYHPDRAGKKYEDKFQLITQSYVYLLKKAEESDYLNIKINKKVEKTSYEDDINDSSRENIYVSKDKFDINQFNTIFEKYKLPSTFDKGYSDLMNKSDNTHNESNNDSIFGTNFNNDIFNAHFDKKKSKKQSNALIEYQEPSALETSLSNFNQSMLGIDDVDDFGAINSGGLSYTDYKKAHIDETMLIDVNKVKYKSYKSVEQLENDRSNVSFTLSPEDKRRQEMMQRKLEEDDNFRMQQQRRHDDMIQSQYKKINQRLIVHK